MTIDAERFLRDFCEIIGTPAVSVMVACSPTPYDGNFPVDRLTGNLLWRRTSVSNWPMVNR